MKQRILDKIEESFKKAEEFYGCSFSRPKNIIFKTNGTRGGHCCYGRSELMFQIELAKNHAEDFISQTVPHEVAHWIDVERYGYERTRTGRYVHHGRTWKYIMQHVYGLNPDRCHDYDVSAVVTKKQERHNYMCNCCGRVYKLSTTKHNRVLRGKVNYSCSRCLVKLSFQPKTNEQKIEELQQQILRLKGVNTPH